jgi:Domain of unknown function (DUF4279)
MALLGDPVNCTLRQLMATLARSAATLRIVGDSLVPDEVTQVLGAAPSASQIKGQELRGKEGRVRIAKSGMWRLHAADTSPADFDAQVLEILAKLSSDLRVWSDLSSRFDVDLFCGWFMEQRNEGLCVSSQTLRSLGERGIELALDIYAGDDEAA